MRKQTIPKILMVEDDINNQQLFKEVLEGAGLQTLILASADGDLVAFVADYEPDIISMDLMIGGSDGVETERDGMEALELLKSNKQTKDIPIFILTSFYEGGKVELAKSLGATDYISLQGQTISNVPGIFLRYMSDPKNMYQATLCLGQVRVIV